MLKRTHRYETRYFVDKIQRQFPRQVSPASLLVVSAGYCERDLEDESEMIRTQMGNIMCQKWSQCMGRLVRQQHVTVTVNYTDSEHFLVPRRNHKVYLLTIRECLLFPHAAASFDDSRIFLDCHGRLRNTEFSIYLFVVVISLFDRLS
jgi:hypothetical protein